MDDKKTAVYNAKGQLIGYTTGTRQASDVVDDAGLAQKVQEQKDRKLAAEQNKPVGLGALAAAIAKQRASPSPTPKKDEPIEPKGGDMDEDD